MKENALQINLGFWSIIVKKWLTTEPKAIYDYQKELRLSAKEVWFVMIILSCNCNFDFPWISLDELSKKSWESLEKLKIIQKWLMNKWYLSLIKKWELYLYNLNWLFKQIEELINRDEGFRNSD